MSVGPTELEKLVLRTVKRSPQYRRIHGRLLSVFPADLWEDEGNAFVQFHLGPEEAQGDVDGLMGAIAVFVVRIAPIGIEAIKVVTPDPSGIGATAYDLLSGSTFDIRFRPVASAAE